MSAEPRLASINRQQLILRSIDVERLVEADHTARLIWQLIGRLDPSLYHARIEAVEGRAGRKDTDPQLLISLWIYAYSRGVSSARELARQCEYEPGCQWLCGLQAISQRTLSGFRSDHKAALNELFVQVRHDERRRIDHAGAGNARWDEDQGECGEQQFPAQRETRGALGVGARAGAMAEREEEDKSAKRRATAQRRAARQRVSRLEPAVREVERLQQEKKHERGRFVARASSSDPEAHVMRNGEGGR